MRLFKTHRIRKTESLDGMWELSRDGEKYLMPVPGCWESNPKLAAYRGKCEYRKKIKTESEQNIRFVFKGVSHTADVYMDDKKIAHHYNAYTPFDAIVQKVPAGEHEIRVEADNSFGEHSALHVPNDYYTYGGITRPAGYEFLPEVYIKAIHVTPIFENNKWSAKAEIELHNLSDTEAVCSLEIEIAREKIQIKDINLNSVQKIEVKKEFSDVKEWSCEAPNLYYVNCRLYVNGECIDDLIDRFGFRRVEISGKDILLNGKKVFLKGFNRHEDYAEVGCAIPLGLMMKDIWLMKDMGANAVRTSHYPNDERFLDICDEMGIMVWEENHARGLYLKDMLHPKFEEQCRDCIDEMIYYHYNHPSIVIWGILNECASETVQGREMYKKQYEQIRRLDRTRPLTSASCRYYKDICLDMPDIVSFNIYSGWYDSNPVREEFENQLDWIYKNGGENKPFIMSEFGGAAMYGFRDPARRKWSEERQADILEETLDVYMKHEAVSGVFIWQFCDCRVTEEGDWFASRACMRNNKGVVDMYRRPKLSYDVVKRKFLEKG